MENCANLFRLRMPGLHAEPQRTHGAGNQDFARRRFARFAGKFYAAAVQALHIVAKPQWAKLETIRAEGIGLDDVRAGFDISLMHTENSFWLGSVEFIEAAL